MEVILTTFVSNKYVFFLHEHEVCQKLNNKYSESSTSQALQEENFREMLKGI